MSSPVCTAPSPEFLAVFVANVEADGGMSFRRFMDLALYHPEVGYYRQANVRIGYASGTDFYTASTSGPLFGELVATACAKRLRAADRDPQRHTFIEIGSETPGGILSGVSHPFAAVDTRTVGATLEIEGDCVVFSNELFDAQPFERTVFRDGAWREVGVKLSSGALQEYEHSTPAPRVADLQPTSDGYRFDRPTGATDLLARLVAQPWRGLFVAFDYGKSLQQLLTETPNGTARAYFRHSQSNDVLARPGQQDLTCHVCWDWLEQALLKGNFAPPALDSQESFLIRHAGDAIEAISAAEAARFSPRKLSLMQLLHPSHLGQKFQVLHAVR